MGGYDAGQGASFPPERFDDFEVLHPLGAGGMGAVFLGRDTRLDRLVALKFMDAADEIVGGRERFLIEARAIARLHHPNVVAIYRIGEVEGQPYLAYEFVAGTPLHELARPIASRRALTIGLGMARGLAAAHARSVLHRDIKPANVILGPGDVPKLIDFGLAKLVGDHDADESSRAIPIDAPVRHGMTSRGAVAGTPAYMAPELWLGAPSSPRSDLYALGLVLWELVAGELPYADRFGAEMAAAILSQGIPSLESVCPSVLRPHWW